MNEKIRRLMEQAVISIDGQTFGKTYIPDEFTERFAELIVAECITTVQARFQGDLNREDLEVRACVEALKNKFGVEE